MIDYPDKLLVSLLAPYNTLTDLLHANEETMTFNSDKRIVDSLFDACIDDAIEMCRSGKKVSNDRVYNYCKRTNVSYELVRGIINTVTLEVLSSMQLGLTTTLFSSGVLYKPVSLRGFILTLEKK